MKINKRRLRQIIKESYMKQRYTEIQDAVLTILWEKPGIAGMDLVAAVQEYGWGDAPVPEQDEVFSILDDLLEENEIIFNEEEDQWSLNNMGDYYDYQRGFKS